MGYLMRDCDECKEIEVLRAQLAVTEKALDDIGKAILESFPEGSIVFPRNRWIKAIYDLSQAKAGAIHD